MRREAIGMDKKKDRITDIFLDFDKIEELVEQMIHRLEQSEEFDPDQPFEMGFSIKVDPNGSTQFVEMTPHGAGPQALDAQTEPFVEIQNADAAFLVTIELPGVQKQHLKLNADPFELTVRTQHTSKNYYKKIRFKEAIRTDGINAEFNNGILEIRLPKKEQQDGINVPLE
jgi:HSP20 family protein